VAASQASSINKCNKLLPLSISKRRTMQRWWPNSSNRLNNHSRMDKKSVALVARVAEALITPTDAMKTSCVPFWHF